MTVRSFYAGLVVFFFSSLTFAQNLPMTPVTVDECATTIRIDGHLDDWPLARMFHLNQKSQVTSGLSFWKDEDDFSGRVFITYNTQYLYFSAVVTKANPVVNDGSRLSLLNGDCVELLISTHHSAKRRTRLSRGDYHFGFSPGTDCKFPSLYCFNLDEEVTGARIVSRKTSKGYVVEAEIPLSFLKGIDLGPGKGAYLDVALDEGGSLSGNRILRMDMAQDDFSPSHPGGWPEVEWIGKDAVSIPLVDPGDLNSDLVMDGTAGETFRGSHPVTGVVQDLNGKPLAGAFVTTWPRTHECQADKSGRFLFDRIKLYDRTLFYARLDGYLTSLAPYVKNIPVTLRLKPIPPELMPETGRVGGFFFGLNLPVSQGGNNPPPLAGDEPSLKTMGLSFLDFSGLDPRTQTPEEMSERLDLFVDYCGQVGCAPLVRLALPFFSAEQAAALVEHESETHPGRVEYWALGNEPDLLEGINDDPDQQPFNVYRYINEFREIYNAMKRVDPGLVIMGPGLAFKYGHAGEDWLTPFLRYDGDIVNLASIHRYAMKAPPVDGKAVLKTLREEPALIRGLEDRVDVNTDVTVPLVVTEAGLFAGPGLPAATPVPAMTPSATPSSGPATLKTPTPTPSTQYDRVWPALWAGEEAGLLITGGIPMAHFSPLVYSPGPVSAFSNISSPIDWALRVMAPQLKGKVLSAQTRMPNLFVFATEDEATRTVQLILVNAGDRYLHPRINVRGGDADVSLLSDLYMDADLEVPEMGLARLTLRDQGRPCESEVYFYRDVLDGKPPRVKKESF